MMSAEPDTAGYPSKPSGPAGASLALIGDDVEVPLAAGGTRRYIDLDRAASTPMLRAVWEAVQEFLPWYASVHRGAGYKSRVATAAYEGARDQVRRFVGAGDDHEVIFVRGTTEAANLLAHAVPDGTPVVTFASEHHANLLPWRRGSVSTLDVPRSADEALDMLDKRLDALGTAALVAVTGASNVTGEIWPIDEIARTVHAHCGRLFVDAAQLAPHHPIDMASSGIDWLAMSGHKLYAPLGAGALIGRRDWLEQGEPMLSGGGAVRYVTDRDVFWTDLPARAEAGSPNVVGVVALGAACAILRRAGMARLAEEEASLASYAWSKLSTIAAVRLLRTWPTRPLALGIFTFTVEDRAHGEVAAFLSAEHAIGVRDGCFCAHPLMLRLLDVPSREAHALRRAIARGGRPHLPGAVRASVGLGIGRPEIDALVTGVCELAEGRARSRYAAEAGSDRFLPDADQRGWPAFRSPYVHLVEGGRAC